jgi:hypothetical protein
MAKVAKGEHGTLPQPGEMGGVDAGGEAEVTILNDTTYQLTVLIGSPNSCRVYSMVGPVFCQEEDRPTEMIRLVPGISQVIAKVNDPGVTPFYGTWQLNGNTAFFNCFCIVTGIR